MSKIVNYTAELEQLIADTLLPRMKIIVGAIRSVH